MSYQYDMNIIQQREEGRGRGKVSEIGGREREE